MYPIKDIGIVLAAGLSKRFGGPKQLIHIGKEPLLVRVIGTALDSSLESVYVILGYKAEKIRQIVLRYLPRERISFVINPQYQEGMSSSIRAAVKSIPHTTEIAVILLGDMPFVSAKAIDILIERFKGSNMAAGAYYTGKRIVHPVIVKRWVLDLFLKIEGDKGGKDVLTSLKDQEQMLLLPSLTELQHLDIDLPRDYIHIKNICSVNNWSHT